MTAEMPLPAETRRLTPTQPRARMVEDLVVAVLANGLGWLPLWFAWPPVPAEPAWWAVCGLGVAGGAFAVWRTRVALRSMRQAKAVEEAVVEISPARVSPGSALAVAIAQPGTFRAQRVTARIVCRRWLWEQVTRGDAVEVQSNCWERHVLDLGAAGPVEVRPEAPLRMQRTVVIPDDAPPTEPRTPASEIEWLVELVVTEADGRETKREFLFEVSPR